MNEALIITWLSSLTFDSIWIVVKGMYLLAFVIYVAFAGVVVSQVKQMEKTIIGGFEKALIIISWLHLGAAVLALLLAFMIL